MKTGIIALLMVAAALAHPPRLVEIAKQVNQMDLTWIADEKIPTRDYTKLLGTFLDDNTPQEFKEVIPRKEFPEFFMAKDYFPECPGIAEIRDQGECGSCWAVACVSAASDRLCIHSKGEDQRRMSDEDMVSCAGEPGSCNGGFPVKAWRYLTLPEGGVTTGGAYGSEEGCKPYSFEKCSHHCVGPYRECGAMQPTPACERKCRDGYPTPYEEDKIHFSKYYGIGHTADIYKEELMTHGPFSVSITVYEDFLTYKSGIYKHTVGEFLGGHAVRIVGWGKEGDVEYFVIANSWNETWGEEGYIRIDVTDKDTGFLFHSNCGLP